MWGRAVKPLRSMDSAHLEMRGISAHLAMAAFEWGSPARQSLASTKTGCGVYVMKGDGRGPSARATNWSTAASTVRSAETSSLNANLTRPKEAGIP